MTTYTVREYDLDDPRDGERLAKMFNGFDSAWPGGFLRGMDADPDHLHQRMRQMQRLAVCVVQFEDSFVGYCDLHAQTGETDTAYIPLLGASLDHHGKGVGKMLLREMVRRVAKLGFRELTLHTWGGNMKAVPLYKKTGFHWEPETSVHMRNFLPGLLNSPAGKAFFAGRDWYTCFEREIVVAPDEVTWNGMKVFPYRFREGDDFLYAMFEAASGGMTALETPEYSVSCTIPVEEAPAGETLPITWQITPHSSAAMDLILLTEADDGLEVQIQERIRIEGPTTLAREMRVAEEAAPRHHGERQRCVRSTLLLDGQPIVLETGVKVVRPIEIDYDGQGLFPGREEKIAIKLRSRLDREVEGTLSLDAHTGLQAQRLSYPFTLPARMSTQCEFTLTAHEAGVFQTTLRYEADGLRGHRPVAFRAFGGSVPLVSVESEYAEAVVLESPGIKVFQHLRGGGLSIHSTAGANASLWLRMGDLGVPFVGWRRKELLYKPQIQMHGAEPVVTLSAASPEFPGLMVERTVSLLGSDLTRIDFRVVNTTNLAQSVQLRTQVHLHDVRHLVLTTADGLIREPRADWDRYPVGALDALPADSSPTESWFAGEEEEAVCGLIWHPEAKLEWDWGTQLTFDLGQLAPHAVHEVAPLYVVVGDGNWEKVRSWWQRLVQPSGVVEAHKPEPKRALEILTEPSPALLMTDAAEVGLVVTNRRGKIFKGQATLKGGSFLVEQETLALEGIDRDHPFRTTLQVTGPDTPSADFVRMQVNTGPYTEEFRLPMVRLAARGALDITEEGEVIRIANGRLTFRVAPAFMGSVISLETDGVNHLHSAYPQKRPFVWFNPWAGGIHPYIDWMGESNLQREAFRGEVWKHVGEQGLPWEGVRVVCEPQHKDYRWLRIEAEYLTLPGSNVMALLYRITNRTDARMWANGGLAAWLQAGGSREQAVMRWKRDDQPRHRRRGGFGMDVQAGKWGAVENDQNGHALMAVITDPRANVWIEDMAEEGAHLMLGGEYPLEPNQTRETLSWLVVDPPADQRDAYAELNRLRLLP